MKLSYPISTLVSLYCTWRIRDPVQTIVFSRSAHSANTHIRKMSTKKRKAMENRPGIYTSKRLEKI